MSGFVGADIEQLSALATTFDRRASAFDQIAASSSSALMVAEWTGADVDRVRSEWNRQARPAIQRVAEELRTLAVDLRKQADQQREASGGGAPAQGWAHEWFGGFPNIQLPPWGAPGWMDPRLPWDIPFGSVPKPSFDWLNGITGAVPGIWGGIGEWIDADRFGSPWSFGDIGQFVPHLDTALNIRDYVDRISAGEFPIHEMIGDLGGEMRSTAFQTGNLPLYLGGAAVGVWDDVIEQAQKGDWSKETFDNNMDFIANDPAEALDAAGDAIVDFFPDLISNFKFW